jgi:hypothetical protein
MVSIKLKPENNEINVNQKTINRRISVKQNKISSFVELLSFNKCSGSGCFSFVQFVPDLGSFFI